MAAPIKETPVLHGKDAERFHKMIEANKHKKVSKEDYERAQKAYKNMRVIGGQNNDG